MADDVRILAGLDELVDVLVARRHERGWTQADLAERIGVAPSTVSHWETRKTEPYGSALFALADAGGWDLALVPRGEGR